MALTSIERFLVDPKKLNIPDEGLGEFVIGFTEERVPFNWAHIFWNLLPGGGQILFLGFMVKHLWMKAHPDRVLLYKNGFIKQTLNGKGNVRSESIVHFNEIKGMLYAKTRQYQNIYGIRKYNCTSASLSVLDYNNVKEEILSGSYRNEEEVEGNYNFIGYACNAISNAWIKFAIDRFNQEMSSRGYATFPNPSGEVQVGRDFIKAGGIVVSSGFKYSFDNGYLYLYPNAAEGGLFSQKSKPIPINVAEMYNKEVFLLAVSQLHGIN